MLRAVLLCLLLAATGAAFAQDSHPPDTFPGRQPHFPKDVALVPANAYQQTGATPTGTTSTTPVMMGLAGTITPRGDGVVLMILAGDVVNNTGGDGATVQVRYGTGTAPTNGGALAGTPCGGTLTDNTGGTVREIFSSSCLATGLSLGTTYWIDVAVAAVTGGTATIADLSLSAVEE